MELLKANPWDVATLRKMADACAALHQNEVELIYLKQALDAEPKNADVNRHCARSLGRMGQFDQAIACWHRIEKIRGMDEEAAQTISQLAEEKLKYPGGRPPANQLKQTVVEEPELQDGSPEDVVLSPQQQLEQVIAKEPQNVVNYRELVQLLLASNQYYAAETVLKRAIAACGEQTALVEQLKRVHSLLAEEEQALAEERAAEQQMLNAPAAIPWLELVLGATILVLIVQFVPAVRATAWRILAISEWSQWSWIAFNSVILLVLVGIRFGPDLPAYVRRKRIRRRLKPMARSAVRATAHDDAMNC